MSSKRPPRATGFSRLDIVRAVCLMALLVLGIGAALERDRDRLRHPAAMVGARAEAPIEAEAGVFRPHAEQVAVAPDFEDDRPAHLRTMEMYRRLRAFSGGPPRVPHGLTSEEFRTERCNVCHQRGGWVARFGTFAPVSPHPEYGACLQCHVARDELVDRPLPRDQADVVCLQCHVNPGAPPPSFVALDWTPAAWPSTGLQAAEGSPLLIPHSVESRSGCLACHAGPGAVVELRTDHPERVNCRQCHVPSATSEPPWAPPSSGTGQGGAS